MAYINVAEWTPDQVTDWLKGLDNSMYHYVQSFTNNQVGGQQLLNIRPYELEQLGMHSIGHQEIVLGAVEHLRNFHYHLDKENLQFLALHVATASSCLYRQLANHCDKKEIETSILNDITRTLVYIKPLVAWLDRSPFKGHSQFMEIRDNILKFGLEMATVAQRDRFVENPVEQIRGTAQKLSKLANYIIQDITDPMVLQPASLEIVTLKKRESDLGFYITHYHGVLRITEVKFNSPAHNSGKIEEGDEIVQINYQTVVGWEYKKVLGQLQESPIDVLLTLKKRPKHTKIYGHIYMKRYRLPSNKRVLPYKWVDNIPSPRPELLSIPNYPMPLSKVPEKQVHSSLESVNSDVLTPTQSKEQDKELRMYLPKPRAVLQRRNTICGDQPTNFKHLGNVMFWLEKRNENKDDDSPSLRDKSISFGFGLELSQRPTTCLGISSVSTNVIRPELNVINGSLPEIMADTTADRNDTKINDEEKLKTGVSKVVRFDSNMKLETYPVDSKYTCNVDNTILETFEPIPYADEEVNSHIEKSLPDVVPTTVHKAKRMSKDIGVVEAVNTIVINRELIKRGKLDKSYSTPTYDDDCENDVPPAIEPRKEYLNKIPPAPPPRPKRLHEQKKDLQNGEVVASNAIEIEPSYNNNIGVAQASSSDGNTSTLPSNNDIVRYTPTMKRLPPTKHFLEEIETLELLTPNKTKSLTWKKKNSLLAKRRKISLKGLGTSDIQGHLYRRAKDKHGVTYWAKLYFVLIDSALYGFKSKDSNKANCLIFLTGFTVSIATEVHSKPFAFKVYHPSKTFYFAAETKEALSQWMEYIRQATLKGNTNSLKSNSSTTSNDPSIKELFTESESSDDDSSNLSGSSNKTLQNSSTNLNASGTKNGSPDQNTSTKSEKIRYHLDFGSLKKFTKSNLPSFSSLHKSSNNVEKKLSSNSVPVPTEQFRSYRKVPGNAGLQLGTNSMTTSTPPQNEPSNPPSNLNPNTILNYNSVTIINNSITLTPPPPQHPAPILSTSPSLSVGSATISITTSNQLNTPLFIDEFQLKQSSRLAYGDDFFTPFNLKSKKNRKQYAHHYIHASNPNLVEFDFQTSRSLDHSLPKINSSNTWDAHPNLQGFVTLKDLMLQKQAEEAKEMYNNRVYLGVEKKDDRLKNKNKKKDIYNRNENSGDDISNSSSKPVINRIQSRSLPKTPDYAQSFKPDDKDIIMARSKEGQKLRDFGYEFISGDDATSAAQNQVGHTKSNSDSWMKRHDKVGPTSSNSLKKKSMNWINPDLKKSNSNNDDDRLFSISTSHRQGSLKKAKNKLENLKASSEKLFQLKHDKHFFTKPSNMSSASSTVSTSSTISASSGIIPIHHSVTHYGRASSGSEKNSYLSKLNFNNVKTQKERKLLGSPRLHRAIFGRSNSSNDAHIDHEAFSPIKRSTDHTDGGSITSEAATSNSQSVRAAETSNSGSPDYPNMEYPPVFEPEIYSLSDPNASLTLLRRRNNHTK